MILFQRIKGMQTTVYVSDDTVGPVTSTMQYGDFLMFR